VQGRQGVLALDVPNQLNPRVARAQAAAMHWPSGCLARFETITSERTHDPIAHRK
jgi:hypothetical protein